MHVTTHARPVSLAARRRIARRPSRHRAPVGTAINLVIRELVRYEPSAVADAATVADGAPAHQVAAEHHLDVATVTRLAGATAAVHRSTGFDFHAWPDLCAIADSDPVEVAAEILQPWTVERAADLPLAG